jgi:hypothetical protein
MPSNNPGHALISGHDANKDKIFIDWKRRQGRKDMQSQQKVTTLLSRLLH